MDINKYSWQILPTGLVRDGTKQKAKDNFLSMYSYYENKAIPNKGLAAIELVP